MSHLNMITYNEHRPVGRERHGTKRNDEVRHVLSAQGLIGMHRLDMGTRHVTIPGIQNTNLDVTLLMLVLWTQSWPWNT